MTFKEARTNAGKSVLEVAHALHVSPQAVYQWERGETTPTVANLVGLAGVCCCDVGDLVRDAQGGEASR